MSFKGLSRRLLALLVTTVFAVGLNLTVTSAGKELNRNEPTVMLSADYIPGELLVRFKENVESEIAMQSLISIHRTLDIVEEKTLPCDTVLFSTDTDVMATVAALERDPRVEFAQPNFIYRSLGVPNDTFWHDQWGMNHKKYGVKAVEAWSYTKGSKNIVVAVIDTGIDYLHEDLAQNMWRNPDEIPSDLKDNDNNGFVDDVFGYDFIGFDSRNPFPDNNPIDDRGHGTHVAGIIAAAANNNKGVAGVAPNVRLMAVDVLDSDGVGTSLAIAQAIYYAAKNGAQIVNLSLGGPGFDRIMYDAIAAHPDVLFIAAAGNGGNDGLGDSNDNSPVSPAAFTKDWVINGIGYPALPNIMSVAALAETGFLTEFSNYGAVSVDIAAPGKNVFSTILDLTNGAAISVSSTYKTMFWGFGAEDLSDLSEGNDPREAIYDSIVRVVYDFFGVTTTQTTTTPLLLVDDDQSEFLGTSADVVHLYSNALTKAGYTFTIHRVGRNSDGPTLEQMQNSSGVIWFTGKTYVSDPDNHTNPNLTPKDQSELIAYLDEGGKLFLSGRNATFGIHNTRFYTNYLKAKLIREVNSLRKLTGVYEPYMNVDYSFVPSTLYLDGLKPLSEAKTVLEYVPPFLPYGDMDGTSMAAPFVSGAAALILSLRGEMSPVQVIDLINSNANKLNSLNGKVASGGTLNIYAALSAIRPVIIDTEPSDKSTQVSVDTNINVTFNENVIASDKFNDITISTNGTPIAYTPTLALNTLTLNPDFALRHNTVYTVSLPADAVRNNIGNSSVTTTFSFTTRSAAPPVVTPPVVTPPDATPPIGTPSVVPQHQGKAVEFIATGAVQSLSVLDGALTLNLPAGAMPAGNSLTITKASEAAENIPIGAKVLSPVFNIKSVSPLVMSSQLSIEFDSNDLGALDPRILMIFRQSPDGTWRRVGGKLDRTANAITTEIDSFSNFTVLGIPKTFNDIQSHWAKNNVELLAARGLIQGREENKFNPESAITRAEMAALLIRLLDIEKINPIQSTFTDVSKNDWYFSVIETAVKNNIFIGFLDGRFKPNENLTREQLASLVSRITGSAPYTNRLPFRDQDNISSWAQAAVNTAYSQGLIRGVSETEFAPKMLVTRAQAAAILARLAERLGLFEVTTTITGTLKWNTLVGGFWDLETAKGNYVILVDPDNRAIESQLKQFQNQRIIVTGLLKTGPNIYMRGSLLHALKVDLVR